MAASCPQGSVPEGGGPSQQGEYWLDPGTDARSSKAFSCTRTIKGGFSYVVGNEVKRQHEDIPVR